MVSSQLTLTKINPLQRILFILALLLLAYAYTNAQTLPAISPQVEQMIGPQLPSGLSTAKGASWFDQNAITRGLALCTEFPATPPGATLANGTITLTQGSKAIKGIGTHFLTEVPNNSYYLVAFNGSYRQAIYIQPPTSDTDIQTNTAWRFSTSTVPYSIVFGEASDYYLNLNYYDQALAHYTNYYRTGDPRFLACGRKIADSWWSSLAIDEGRSLAYEGGEGYSPRTSSLGGLMLRALDGRPELWPWIVGYTRNQFNTWVDIPTGWAIADPSTAPLYFGVRDGGYMLFYASKIAMVHPDPTIRQEFRDKALRSAVYYYAKLQKPDGSYRWNDDTYFTGSEQPFQVGLLNEAMISVHKLTNDPLIKAAILKSAEHEYQFSYNKSSRAIYYLVHGGWKNGPSCETGCGAAASPFPPAPTDDAAKQAVFEARQLNATALHVFGYAYLISGDIKFKQWGDEIFSSTYEGADGYRGLANSRSKEYDESYRSGARYLAWREGLAISPQPSPSPTPSPSPSPTPQPRVIGRSLSSDLTKRIQQINDIETKEGLRLIGCSGNSCYFERP